MEIATHEFVLPSVTRSTSLKQEKVTVNPEDAFYDNSVSHADIMPVVKNNCTDENVMESFDFITFAKQHLVLLIILFGVLLLIVMKCVGWCFSKSSAKNISMAAPSKVHDMPFTSFKVIFAFLCIFHHSFETRCGISYKSAYSVWLSQILGHRDPYGSQHFERRSVEISVNSRILAMFPELLCMPSQ